MIKAICFDADGVVVNPQKQFSRYLESEHGITPQMTGAFFRGEFNDCLLGRAELGEVLPPYLRAWNWNGSVEGFIATWLQRDHVIDYRLVDAIQRLRQNGVVCCLATSQERNRADYMRSVMGFQDAFDRLFISCEVGSQKPEFAFYQHIEEDLRLEKDSILFWDDLEINVMAARENGWFAEVYTGFEDFEKNLQLYLPGYNEIRP